MFTQQQEIKLLLTEKSPQKVPGNVNTVMLLQRSSMSSIFAVTSYFSLTLLSKAVSQAYSYVILHSLSAYALNGMVFFVQCGKSRLTALMMNIASFFVLHMLFFLFSSLAFYFAMIPIAKAQYYSLCMSYTQTSLMIISIARFLEATNWCIGLFCRPEMKFALIGSLSLSLIIMVALYAQGHFEKVADMYPIVTLVCQLILTVLVVVDFYWQFPKHMHREFSTSKYCFSQLFFCALFAFVRILQQAAVYFIILLFSIKYDYSAIEDTSEPIFLLVQGAISTILSQVNHRMIKPIDTLKLGLPAFTNAILLIINKAFNNSAFNTDIQFNHLLFYYLLVQLQEIVIQMLYKRLPLLDSFCINLIHVAALMTNFINYPQLRFTYMRLIEFLFLRIACYLIVFACRSSRLHRKKKRVFTF